MRFSEKMRLPAGTAESWITRASMELRSFLEFLASRHGSERKARARMIAPRSEVPCGLD